MKSRIKSSRGRGQTLHCPDDLYMKLHKIRAHLGIPMRVQVSKALEAYFKTPPIRKILDRGE